MSKDYSHIPAELVTIKEAADVLSANGDKTSPQNLRKYARAHDLIEKKVGRMLMVNPRKLFQFRAENFTTEVMRGGHSKDTNIIDLPLKGKSKSKTKSAKTKTTPKSASTSAPEPTTLDRARDAKASKEEAQAEKLQLELARLKNDLVETAEVEAAAAVAMTSLKEHLLGPALSDTTDYILATLNLPDDKKRPLQSALRKKIAEALTKQSDVLTAELAALDDPHKDGLPTRLDILMDYAAKLRKMSPAQYTHAAKAHNKAPA